MTVIRNQGKDAILLNLHARAYETGGWDTMFEKSVTDLSIYTATASGCFIDAPISLSEGFANTFVSAPVGHHDYTRLYPASALINDVSCRTNKPGGDDGYVGCSEINLRPIPVKLQHVELVTGGPLPEFDWPAWLPRTGRWKSMSAPPPERPFVVNAKAAE